ncbi:stalled ribosome sensor GCN1-like [Lineus longissimus]|uniref:stalled ribosome sensor GCN1-like n=1 Tax=Lineus longissimus TaxID=88925 RepID=UPI00315D2A0F
MADTELMEALKAFALQATTSKVGVRASLLQNLLSCSHLFSGKTPPSGKKELPDNVLKGFVKILLSTLPFYKDGKSQRLVNDIFVSLAKCKAVSLAKYLSQALAELFEPYKKANPCKHASGMALRAFYWTYLVIKEGRKAGTLEFGAEFKALVEVQSVLCYVAFSAQKPIIDTAMYRKSSRLWKEFPDSLEHYLTKLSSSELGVYKICLIGCVMKHLGRLKDIETINKNKATFLESYNKDVLGGKTKPAIHVLDCAKNLLRHVTHEEFKEMIMPYMKKMMLRNPEIIIDTVSHLLSSVSIDLSQYAADLVSQLGSQLHVKDDQVRDSAVAACKALALQCSDRGAVEKMAKHLFGVLNGSEGKLSVTSHRQSVLSAIGNLTRSPVSGASVIENLAGEIGEMFIPFLKQEVHEATLAHALSMFSMWCSKFSREVPTKIIQWFPTGIALKTSTSPVRIAYLQCMNEAFTGDTLIQAGGLVNILLQTLEKASSQPSQFSLVTEAVSASCLLVRLSIVDIQLETKLGPFWAVVLDMKKQLFFNDKYLQMCNSDDSALQALTTLSERLVLDHPTKFDEKNSRPLYKVILQCLTHPRYKVRQHGQATVKKLLATLGGTKLALSLIEEFSHILNSQKLPAANQPNEEGDASSELVRSPRVLHDGLLAVCDFKSAGMIEARSAALTSLFVAHHPYVVAYNQDLWVDLLAGLKLDAGAFVRNRTEEILDLITKEDVITESISNALTTLTRVAPDAILPRLEKHCCDLLSDSTLQTITKEEYGIFTTPEGHLYDMTEVDKAGEEMFDKNIRKESKLYSFEDQMAAIEEKREMERKRIAEGKGRILNKKQQEIFDTLIKKEKEIRNYVKERDDKLRRACALLSAALKGSPLQFGKTIRAILRVIVPLFSSPMAAPRVTELFVVARKAVFDEENWNLGSLIAYSTLRLMQPECMVDVWWCQEPIKQQAQRAINLLHKFTMSQDDGAGLFTPCFSYCFYLLKCILKVASGAVGRDAAIMQKALEIMSQFAELRSKEGKDSKAYGPDLLPRKEMLDLLLYIIGTGGGKVHQTACAVLAEVANSGSGNAGCAEAEQDEVDALLKALQAPAASVREAALLALQAMVLVLPTPDVHPEHGMKVLQRLLIAQFDQEENVANPAKKLFEDAGLEMRHELCTSLIDELIHQEEVIRRAASLALGKVLEEFPNNCALTLAIIYEKYEEMLYMPPPILDNFGRVVSEQPPDKWEARTGLALAVGKISPLVPEDQINPLFSFFVDKGLRDRNEDVRKHMLAAAVLAVEDHGKENVITLLPVFEDFLAKAPDSASYDSVRQSVVVLMGSLARHLEKDDPKVKPIIAKLITTLSTPSQQVQEAVANCLPPLVPAIKQDAPELVQKLIHLLLESENYGERKGAAYGLAGLVKGLGILALKQLDIMSTLQDAIQNKKNPKYREGALLAFEMLCLMLGRLFEPYVVHILPHLLLCFGDNNQYVREAADETAKAVMSKLSAHGVKLVLPSLLSALEEDSWRTKQGSVELLGAMAFCAPKQLSACLPSIVPKLTEVLTDSHMKVNKAGAQALRQIGSVIRNPEIQEIVPDLLDALQEPTKKTTPCLCILLETKFVHFIDAPSLALIMPVVQRAFQDRSTETRKMASQIIGNMYSLTDQKDLSPYLPNVIPGLKQSLLDPVPEVRTVSSRALGAMVKGMGESSFEDLLPWLMQTLTSESSSVDRSGAAQGLSEVVGGLGLEKLEKLMPDIIQTAERSDIAPHVRDGYIMMYIYLPSVFGEDFMPYIGPILPSILKALADECEYVRDTALKAGQRIVNLYADTAIALLLPELERGLFDDNWRIRYSSVQLLGDLLYRISGVTGKMSTEGAGDDDNFGTELSQKAIFKALGPGRKNRVLAGLYMGRSDTALMVRQAALHVWKVIVANTPKTLKDILGTLFTLLLGCLASTSYDKRQVAARTLGDIVRKLGERVLPEIIPILEKGLESDQADQRQGVCIGLSEIMSSTSKDHVMVYAESLIPTVRKALMDPLPEVREAAAKTFDQLHSNIGQWALDDILPHLLNQLNEEPDLAEPALDGLKQVMAVKSRVVLPYLVPQLTAEPVNSRALAFLSSVTGEALTKHLGKILPALMSALSKKLGTPDESEEKGYCESVILSVQDPIGVRTIMDELLGATHNSNELMATSSVIILHSFCSQTKVDYSEYIPQLLNGMILLFTHQDQRLLLAGWECLNAVTKKLDATDMLQHIANVRQSLRFALKDFKGEELPGFCLPKKGIAPILPIFREGILNGPAELKEAAAVGLGEVIRRTSPDALKTSVVHITGPLIRILGDRYGHNVKVAVLETLSILLGKCGVMLKPFLPQLQTTFMKALNDPHRQVRLRAAEALGKLIVIHSKVDPLFGELHTAVKTTDDPSVRETMLQGLRGCLTGCGGKMGEAVKKQISATLISLISSGEDATRTCASGCLGALCAFISSEELAALMIDQLLDTDQSVDWTLRHGRSVALMVALKEAASPLLSVQSVEKIEAAVIQNISSDRMPITLSGLRSSGFLMKHILEKNEVPSAYLFTTVCKSMKNESNDVKQCVSRVMNYVAGQHRGMLPKPLIKAWVPMLVNGCKEKNTMVKSNSEYALIRLLRMKEGDEGQQSALAVMESGMKDALSDLIGKSLRRTIAQSETVNDLDDTILR